MTKPPKAAIRKWVNALRSDEYEQGRTELQGPGGYCCLGVACKIFIQYHELKQVDGRIAGGYPSDQPASPKWLADINTSFEELTGTALSHRNDIECDTFDEIADLLQLVYLENALD